MAKWMKKELQGLGFRFTLDRMRKEVQLFHSDWKTNVRCQLRLVVQNRTKVAIARPAKGSFRLGYDWLAVFPLRGYGYNRIRKLVERRLRQYNHHPVYADLMASAFEVARQMLLKAK